ncbi:Protein LYK2 [Linum perenne]
MRRKVGIYIAVICGVIVGSIAVAAAFFLVIMLLKRNKNKKKPQKPRKKKKQSISNKDADLELQQLSLSVRTTSDKKVSFESSQQDSLDIPGTTPRKGMVILESYTADELRRATEDFSSSNLIEGNVYHGRLNGKNMAIKRVKTEVVSKIDFGILSIPTHHHPKILRLIGTCLDEGSEHSYLVFEYAKNGSLRDWLLGGLAMKNQFIASCYCFLTWNQRLKICLDVAVGLQYMHLIMSPSYVHRNLRTRNIFLDEDFNAKIGNFAMAKLVEEEGEEEDSNAGKAKDIGYLAPEYLNKDIVSPGVDIYAYGVVLLEVLSGKTAADRGNAEKLEENVKGILASENGEKLKDWMDSALGDNYPFDGAVALANLARTCVEEETGLRPSAGDIVEKLSVLVEELSVGEGEGGGGESNNMSLCESSCKPLVKAAAESMR